MISVVVVIVSLFNAWIGYHYGLRRGFLRGLKRGLADTADAFASFIGMHVVPLLKARGVTRRDWDAAVSKGCGREDCATCSKLAQFRTPN